MPAAAISEQLDRDLPERITRILAIAEHKIHEFNNLRLQVISMLNNRAEKDLIERLKAACKSTEIENIINKNYIGNVIKILTLRTKRDSVIHLTAEPKPIESVLTPEVLARIDQDLESSSLSTTVLPYEAYELMDCNATDLEMYIAGALDKTIEISVEPLDSAETECLEKVYYYDKRIWDVNSVMPAVIVTAPVLK